MPPKHRRGEGLQAGHEAHVCCTEPYLAAYITPASAASAAPIMKVAEITRVGPHAHQAGDARVLGGRAHRAAELGAVDEVHQARSA